MCQRKAIRKNIPVTFAVLPTDNSQSINMNVDFIPDEVIIKYVGLIDGSDEAASASLDRQFSLNIPTLITTDNPLLIGTVSTHADAKVHNYDLAFPVQKRVSNTQTIILMSASNDLPSITGQFIMGLQFVKYIE